MRRSVRNGIAIAGMAGGVWFLGQAVAQADGITQTNDTAQANSQTADSQNGGGVTGNSGGNANSSSNYADITVSTHVVGGAGGTNTSNVNTGIQGSTVVAGSGGGGGGGVMTPNTAASLNENRPSQQRSNDVNASVSISTRSVSVEQNANGGNVSGSGNISELPTVNQSNNVWQSNTQTATSTEDNHHNWGKKKGGGSEFDSRGMGRGNDGLTGNIGGNFNESSNTLYLDVSTYVRGGRGGDNYSNVNTGAQDALLLCSAKHGDAWCETNIETGSVSVLQNANGGNVSDSGNIGGSHGQNPAGSTPPKKNEMAAAVSPAAAPGAKHAAALSSAQPSKGSLAFTGADVSLALTLGLLALGLGGAFTLAGRRRETGTV
jgi:hypothetical protein